MCTLPVQFLRAAIIGTNTPSTNQPEIQLAIPLIAMPMDQTITQWAMACYSFYHMHPTATGINAQIGAQNQQTQLATQAINQALG